MKNQNEKSTMTREQQQLIVTPSAHEEVRMYRDDETLVVVWWKRGWSSGVLAWTSDATNRYPLDEIPALESVH